MIDWLDTCVTRHELRMGIQINSLNVNDDLL